MEENIGVGLFDYGFCNGFLDMTANAQATKRKKEDYIKIQDLLLQKTPPRKWRGKLIHWKKMFANHFDKITVSRIYK